MFKKFLTKVIIALVLCLYMAIAVFADTPPAAISQPTTVIDSSEQTLETEYCPQPNQLILKDMWWGAPGSWRSYNRSFVKTITGFEGAQWVGVNVGIVICIYQGDNSHDFPVMIQRSTIVPTPKGGLWILQKQSGYMNCLSNQVTDCPFAVPKSTKLLPQQLNQALDSIKPSASQEDE